MDTADQLCDKVSFIVNRELIATDKPQDFKEKYGR